MSKKILLVDDDRTTRETLRLLIERYTEGLELVSVETGEAASEHLTKDTFDLVISDVMRPGLDGHALHGSIRGSAGHADVPFLFLTGMPIPPPSDPRDHVLGKPFSAKEFLQRIRRILELDPKPETQRVSEEDLKPSSTTRMKTTRFIARRFEQLFEGHYVRILQRTENPVPIDTIQRHLMFSRLLSNYNLSEYMLKGAGEISIEVEEVPALPGRHGLRFFLLLRSENPRLPVERVLIPEMPEFLVARKTDELTLEAEVERTVDFVRAVYLADDLEIPPEAILGNRLELSRLEALAADVLGQYNYANLVVHLRVERRQFKTLGRWKEEGLDEILDAREDPLRLRKALIEATLGLEELSSFFPDRPGLTKGASYLSATNLLVHRRHGPTYSSDECPVRLIDRNAVPIAGLDDAPEVEIEDPLGKVLFDNDHWSSLLNQFFFPDSVSPGYRLYAVRYQAPPATHPA